MFVSHKSSRSADEKGRRNHNEPNKMILLICLGFFFAMNTCVC